MDTKTLEEKKKEFISNLRYALDRFNWFDSALGAEALRILNTWEADLDMLLKDVEKEANVKIREQIKRVLKTKEEGSYESTADFITDLEYYTSEEYLTSDMTN